MPEPTSLHKAMFPDPLEVGAYHALETLDLHAMNIASELLEIIKLARTAHLNLQDQAQAQAQLATIPDLFQAAMTAVTQTAALASDARTTIFREYERQGKANVLLRDDKHQG